MLERDAPYVQIIEHYRQEIRAGRLQDGDMLPSGREIAAAVRRLPGHRGQGRHRPAGPRPGHSPARAPAPMVTAPRPPADRARGGPLLITLATRTPARPGDKARVLEAGLVEAPQTVAAQLGRRAHGAGDPPAAGHGAGRGDGRGADVMVPGSARRSRAGPAAEDAAGRGDQRLQPAWGEDWVSARPPTSAEAREFGIKRGSPVVVVHSRRFAADDTVLEYCRADRPRGHPRRVPLRLSALHR